MLVPMACSFTGHRQIDPSHSWLPDLLDRAIAYAYAEGCRDFYLGGALGFDTLAARRTLAFRTTHRDVRVNLVLPCFNQDEGWSEVDRAIYSAIISEADSVEYVSAEYKRGCMQKRNRRLIALSDIVIAYVGRERSGSSQTVRLAREAGKRVYNLYFGDK